jgi:tetratricopeptide (TPR) repeat protein
MSEINEQLRARREATPSALAPGQPLSRQELADRVNDLVSGRTGRPGALDANYIGKLERGVIARPRADYRWALREVLSARTDRELGLDRLTGTDLGSSTGVSVRSEVGSAVRSDLRSALDDGGDDSPAPRLPFDSLFAIARRVHRLTTSNVSTAGLDRIGAVLDTAVEQYESVGPARLLTEVLPQRRWLDELLTSTQPPRDRLALYRVAARMSGLLAAMALDLGSTSTARGYAAESFALADLVGGPDLKAWARATQSLIEYYAGHFEEAVDLAQDGLRISPRGPQSIRLAINGAARALGRLGRVGEMEAAIDRAFTLLADLPDDGRVSTSLGSGPYCRARVTGNAATGYLWAGDPGRAAGLVTQTLSTWDAAGLAGPRALSRLDLATALLRGPRPEVEEASAIVVQALSISPSDQFEPVRLRVEEFLRLARRWRDVPAIGQVRDLLEASRRPSDDPAAEALGDVVDGGAGVRADGEGPEPVRRRTEGP